jgi:hypothetical protein
MFAIFNGEKRLHHAVDIPNYKLMTESSFSKDELNEMYSRYCHVCRDDGRLTSLELNSIISLEEYPMLRVAFEHEVKSGDSVDFSCFVCLLGKFSPRATIDVKRQCN